MSKLNTVFALWKDGQFDIIRYKLAEMLGIGRFFLPYPTTLTIEPTNACNLHCPTCPTGAGKLNRPVRMMSLQEFAGIVDQVKGYVKNMTLMNYGEPFLNKDVLDMIKYATSAGIKVLTSTNGNFFRTKQGCVELVQSGIHYLVIALDGGDQETLSRFRKGGSNFNEIVNGIKMVCEAKRDLSSATPIVELQFIVMKHNEHQKITMKQLSKELGVDVYGEKTVGINYNDPDFQKLAQELLPNDLEQSRYFLQPDGTFALKGAIQNRCSQVHSSAVINSDGTVVPCCYDAYSEYIMGNVFTERFETIWNSPKYNAFRKQIRKDRASISICNICPECRHSFSKKERLG